MIRAEVLDVTKIEPRRKHPTIFEHFDDLEGGEGFILDNDHDPKPLYYELLAERGDIFTWEYLAQGPERWQVRIAKRGGAGNADNTISEKDIQKAALLKEKGTEFNCGS